MVSQQPVGNQRSANAVEVRTASSSVRAVALLLDLVPLLLLTVAMSTSWLSSTALQRSSRRR